jgi:hypothetical protein
MSIVVIKLRSKKTGTEIISQWDNEVCRVVPGSLASIGSIIANPMGLANMDREAIEASQYVINSTSQEEDLFYAKQKVV